MYAEDEALFVSDFTAAQAKLVELGCSHLSPVDWFTEEPANKFSAKYNLDYATHGKDMVWVMRVERGSDGMHNVREMSVQVVLQNPFNEKVFVEGDNRQVLATDTIKNRVHSLTTVSFKEKQWLENYATALAEHFLHWQPGIINRAVITVTQEKWNRIDSDHPHAFTKKDVEMYVRADSCWDKTSLKTRLYGGLKNIQLIKTTQSGFAGFVKNKFTILPDTTDRVLYILVDAEWEYQQDTLDILEADCHDSVLNSLHKAFAGDKSTGIFSPSVQHTMWDMGCNTLEDIPQLASLHLKVPNRHVLPIDTQKFGIDDTDLHGKKTL